MNFHTNRVYKEIFEGCKPANGRTRKRQYATETKETRTVKVDRKCIWEYLYGQKFPLCVEFSLCATFMLL